MRPVSRAERAAIFRLVVTTDIKFDAMQEYLTGRRRPVGWVARQICQELGDGWEERFAEGATT